MIVSIYLHKYVVDTLQLFGNLDETINKILQAGADGDIEILDRPPCMNQTVLEYQYDELFIGLLTLQYTNN